MIQLIYVSNAVPQLCSGDLFKIVEMSAQNNMRDELTGFLIFANGRFLQLIEGPEAAIDALLYRLAKDDRHGEISIVNRQPIGARAFPKWRMKRLLPTSNSLPALDSFEGLEDAAENVKTAVAEFLESDNQVRRRSA